MTELVPAPVLSLWSVLNARTCPLWLATLVTLLPLNPRRLQAAWQTEAHAWLSAWGPEGQAVGVGTCTSLWLIACLSGGEKCWGQLQSHAQPPHLSYCTVWIRYSQDPWSYTLAVLMLPGLPSCEIRVLLCMYWFFKSEKTSCHMTMTRDPYMQCCQRHDYIAVMAGCSFYLFTFLQSGQGGPAVTECYMSSVLPWAFSG